MARAGSKNNSNYRTGISIMDIKIGIIRTCNYRIEIEMMYKETRTCVKPECIICEMNGDAEALSHSYYS